MLKVIKKKIIIFILCLVLLYIFDVFLNSLQVIKLVKFECLDEFENYNNDVATLCINSYLRLLI